MTFLRSPQRLLLWAALAVTFATYRRGPWGTFSVYGLGLLVVAAILFIQAVEHSASVPDQPTRGGRLVWVAFAVLVLVYLFAAATALRVCTGDVIDVYLFEHEAARALLHGVNPYTITHPNIYGPRDEFYGPGTVVGRRVQLGFPYPPLALYYVVPAYLLGDVRYASMAAILMIAVMILGLRADWQTLAMAVVLLLNPLTLFVVTQSWTEPLVALTLAGVVYAATRRPRWLPVALGIFLASKQYAVLGLPLAWFLLRDPEWRSYLRVTARAVAVALLISAPLVLWNVRAFFHDVVWFQFTQPFRPDALSFAVLRPIPLPLVLVATALAIAWSLERARRHPAYFAACYGFVMLVFVALNKQAFANYYFLISASFLLGAATTSVPVRATGIQSDSNSAAITHAPSLLS